MITVNDYIKNILQKKNWTLQMFAIQINRVKFSIGIESKTTSQNISNFLNQVDKKHVLRPKQLVIWENALDLPMGTLSNMVEQPKTKAGIQELEKLKRKIKEKD